MPVARFLRSFHLLLPADILKEKGTEEPALGATFSPFTHCGAQPLSIQNPGGSSGPSAGSRSVSPRYPNFLNSQFKIWNLNDIQRAEEKHFQTENFNFAPKSICTFIPSLKTIPCSSRHYQAAQTTGSLWASSS